MHRYRQRKGGHATESFCLGDVYNLKGHWVPWEWLQDECILLEDITDKFWQPYILDVKIGRHVWDNFAEKDKIEHEKKKYPAQEVIGWRIKRVM